MQFLYNRATFYNWLNRQGKGHVQMLVRGILTYVQAFCSFLLVYNEIDPWHKYVLFICQCINGTSLCMQYKSNNFNHFLLRSISAFINFLQCFHLAICGRRSWIAGILGDEEFIDNEEWRRAQKDYPDFLGRHTHYCFSPGLK